MAGSLVGQMSEEGPGRGWDRGNMSGTMGAILPAVFLALGLRISVICVCPSGTKSKFTFEWLHQCAEEITLSRIVGEYSWKERHVEDLQSVSEQFSPKSFLVGFTITSQKLKYVF